MDLIDALNKFLNAPLVNTCQSLYDDYVKANAEFRSSAGMVEKIVRTTDGHCCEWCANLAGTYEYGTEPKDVYRRHDNCGCQVTFISEKGAQDVHSKQYLSQSEIDERAKRKTVGKTNDAEEKAKIDIRKTVGLNTKIETGAKYGALNNINDPEHKKRDAHASLYYEELRNGDKNSIADKISSNSGIDKTICLNAIDHLIYQKHNLEKGYSYFDSDYDMSESLQRLILGDNIKPHDIVLIMHENIESKYMQDGMDYEKAHELANQQYNYQNDLVHYLKKGK